MASIASSCWLLMALMVSGARQPANLLRVHSDNEEKQLLLWSDSSLAFQSGPEQQPCPTENQVATLSALLQSQLVASPDSHGEKNKENSVDLSVEDQESNRENRECAKPGESLDDRLASFR